MTKEKVNWFYAASLLFILIALLWWLVPHSGQKDLILISLDIVDIFFWGIAVWPFVCKS